LARNDQPLRAQRGDRLPHDGAADACGARELLLGGQALARAEAAALDLLGELVEEPPRQLARGGERTDAHHLDVGSFTCMMTENLIRGGTMIRHSMLWRFA